MHGEGQSRGRRPAVGTGSDDRPARRGHLGTGHPRWRCNADGRGRVPVQPLFKRCRAHSLDGPSLPSPRPSSMSHDTAPATEQPSGLFFSNAALLSRVEGAGQPSRAGLTTRPAQRGPLMPPPPALVEQRRPSRAFRYLLATRAFVHPHSWAGPSFRHKPGAGASLAGRLLCRPGAGLERPRRAET
jgi:hypothetical protein